jgi:hypothetical protein
MAEQYRDQEYLDRGGARIVEVRKAKNITSKVPTVKKSICLHSFTSSQTTPCHPDPFRHVDPARHLDDRRDLLNSTIHNFFVS